MNEDLLLSIIIPVFNRQDMVCRSIASSIATFSGSTRAYEVIVVDDGSTDGSVQAVRCRFGRELQSGLVKLLVTGRNGGVSRARNAGAAMARGTWLMFLDSDDFLIESAMQGMVSALDRHAACPVVFFRCRDQDGQFIGQHFDEEVILETAGYARTATFGEAMPVVRRAVVVDKVFDESLVGYEGLSLLRLIARHGPGVLSTVVARVYDRSGNDRLSTFKGMVKRADTLARGHRQLVREFGQVLPWVDVFRFLAKSLVYSTLSGGYKMAQWSGYRA
jgi:glycosyltransferase involved in cell wall biosynthesis